MRGQRSVRVMVGNVRRWYLRMDDPAQLRPAREREGVTAVHAEVPSGPLNRWLYGEIGRDFGWDDRRTLTAADWQREAEAVETWLAVVRGTPAGFAELRRTGGGTIDVAVFGLLEAFRGIGAGGTLLTAVVRRAWELGAQRVTVDTCSFDGPHALDNYRARGFEVVREIVEAR
jgi:GNAT superfamily N-acetyltransferase